jgi:hypothetical protein
VIVTARPVVITGGGSMSGGGSSGSGGWPSGGTTGAVRVLSIGTVTELPSDRVIVCVPAVAMVAVTSAGGVGVGVVTATVLVVSTGTVVVLPSGHVMTCVPVVCMVALMRLYIPIILALGLLTAGTLLLPHEPPSLCIAGTWHLAGPECP